MAQSTNSALALILGPFSTKELAERSGLASRDVARWRTGVRVPHGGPNQRALAQALMDLREAAGLPCGDYAATIAEVITAARIDSKRYKR